MHRAVMLWAELRSPDVAAALQVPGYGAVCMPWPSLLLIALALIILKYIQILPLYKNTDAHWFDLIIPCFEAYFCLFSLFTSIKL